MIELLALLGAIVLVVVVQQLRALLALPFARRRFAALPAAPEALQEPLLDQLQVEAAALGFSGPTWLRTERVDGDTEAMPFWAVYGGPDGVGRLWAAPPVNAALPQRLACYLSHRLADGRTAISQAFDPYFTLLQGGDLVARTASEPDLERQWRAHGEWLATLGSAPVAIADADLVADTEAFFERLHRRLLAEGATRAITPDLAVPRLPLALRALRAMRALPKPAADPRPLPAPRLARLAVLQELVNHRAPPRDVQWGLFAVSVALFVALGALFWNVALAVSILVVVVVHELGHFLAMRAFGYRNVHILALPLVGGVAIGHDVDPGASKRAWMSLMGPLPGIVIGWLLLAAIVLGGLDTDWLLPLATVFLFVNYLNVLPIPPLDGAHVVEALLPARWARLQTVLIAVAAVLGALLAWHFDLYLLTVLALLQLPALRGNWRLHGVERELAAAPLAPGTPREARLLRILQRLEATLGPTALAVPRIREALQVMHRIEVRPMGAAARLATSLVYLALLVVPVVGLVGYGLVATGDEGTATAIEEEVADRATLQAQAAQLPLATVLTEATEDRAPLPAPASAEAIAAAEARLGRALPEELRALYQIADGVPSLHLRPLAEIGAPTPEVMRLLELGGGKLNLESAPGQWLEFELADATRWWQIGDDEEAPLFYLPEPEPRLPGTRVISYFIESPAIHGSLRDYLVALWIDRREAAAWLAVQQAAQARNSALLADTPVAELLAEWPEPHFLARWLAPDFQTPEGADEATLAAAEQRLGLRLPEELRSVLAAHDGFPPLQLLPSARLLRWRDAEVVPGLAQAIAVQHCLIVAGRVDSVAAERAAYPTLVWCPDGQPAAWVEPASGDSFPTLKAWLLPKAALAKGL